MKKILFITHDTTRSGAPIVLLNFIKWIKKNKSKTEVAVLSLRGGELKNEFRQVADKYFELPGISFWTRIKNKIYGITGIQNSRNNNISFVGKLARQDFDIVYSNTINSIPIAASLKHINKKIKFVAHIHELQTVIDISLPNLSEFISHIDFFLSPSEMVTQNLMFKYEIPQAKIETVYEFTKVRPYNDFKKLNAVFQVGAAGTAHWRKGHDVFLQVARYIKNHHPDLNIKFTWIGALPEMEKCTIDADIKKMNLENIVIFTGAKLDPEEFYRDFDIFLLTSREDPFPLVCIEVGMLGKPIICFEKASGSAEVLNIGGGFVVPYLNIERMAEKVVFYYKNPGIMEQHGKEGQLQFSRFTPENICPKIWSILQGDL